MTDSSDCEFCCGEFDNTVIKAYDCWTVQLFLDQKYLGRSLIKLNRHEVDFFDINKHEREELSGKVVPQLKKALDDLFGPDLYNYASLGNDCRHLHLHIIPRYRDSREFRGVKFEDNNWNHHYKTEQTFEPNEQVFNSIKNSVSEEIGK